MGRYDYAPHQELFTGKWSPTFPTAIWSRNQMEGRAPSRPLAPAWMATTARGPPIQPQTGEQGARKLRHKGLASVSNCLRRGANHLARRLQQEAAIVVQRLCGLCLVGASRPPPLPPPVQCQAQPGQQSIRLARLTVFTRLHRRPTPGRRHPAAEHTGIPGALRAT